jgi:hypothetical protein
MSDQTERPPVFEATPQRVGPSGGSRWALIVGVIGLGLVAVAVVKPWGDGWSEAARRSLSLALSATPSPAAADAVPGFAADALPGLAVNNVLGAAIDAAQARRPLDIDERARRPVALSGDPVAAAGPLVAEIAGHGGEWGIGAGGWVLVGSHPSAWTTWQAVTPKRRDDAAVPLGRADRERVCDVGPHFRRGAAVLAVTAPPGVQPDWVVNGWVVEPDGRSVVTPLIERVPGPADAPGGISALVFADGLLWADGVYRLDVQGDGNRLSIDICLGTGSSSGASSSGGAIRTISEGLVGRSGEWGVGTGGPDGGARSVWVVWRGVSPVQAFGTSQGIQVPPSCEAGSAMRAGIVVALTVPRALVPDWTVQTARFIGGRWAFEPSVRQVSPPGNRGITYLVHADGSAWRAGQYRFRIRTSSGAVDLGACLAG